MKQRLIGLLVGLSLGVLTALALPSPAKAGYSLNCWWRDSASSYGYTAVNEPYRTTHAWWVDDDYSSPDEGTDCSGLVFKSWAMVNSAGDRGKYYWYTDEDTHGPYYARYFVQGGTYGSCSGACYTICGAGTGSSCGSGSYWMTYPMDAFARPSNGSDEGHIGLIWEELSGGTDYILEARQPGYTAGIFERSYRTENLYEAVVRYYWSDMYCEP